MNNAPHIVRRQTTMITTIIIIRRIKIIIIISTIKNGDLTNLIVLTRTYVVYLNLLRNQVSSHNSWLHSPPLPVRSGCFAATIDHNEEKRPHFCLVCQTSQPHRGCGYVCTRTGVSRCGTRVPLYYSPGCSSCIGRKSYFQCVSCRLSDCPRSERRYFVLYVSP